MYLGTDLRRAQRAALHYHEHCARHQPISRLRLPQAQVSAPESMPQQMQPPWTHLAASCAMSTERFRPSSSSPPMSCLALPQAQIAAQPHPSSRAETARGINLSLSMARAATRAHSAAMCRVSGRCESICDGQTSERNARRHCSARALLTGLQISSAGNQLLRSRDGSV